MKTDTLGAGSGLIIEFNLDLYKKSVLNTSSALSSFGAITLLFEAKHEQRKAIITSLVHTCW